jgi:hypothetical protein
MSPFEMSKLENSIRSVLAFHEALSRRDQARMQALLSEDCRLEGPALEADAVMGSPFVAQFWLEFCPTGTKMEIEEVFGMGMRCVLRWKLTRVDGSHLRGVNLVHLKGGLIWQMLVYVKGTMG